MEDKRIIKTKRNLKRALIALAAEKPFEQITVTELCKAADTSRITFYTHYSDKYELVEEVFRDMRAEASKEFYRLQSENNPNRDEVQSYCNLMDCILDVYYGQSPFFSHAKPQDSYYLFCYLHYYIIENVERYIRRERPDLPERHPVRRMVAFVCSGLWAAIDQGQAEGYSLPEIREQAKQTLRALLKSGALNDMFQ